MTFFSRIWQTALDNGVGRALIPINPIIFIEKGDGEHERSDLQGHVYVLLSVLVFAEGLFALHMRVTPEWMLKRDEAA